MAQLAASAESVAAAGASSSRSLPGGDVPADSAHASPKSARIQEARAFISRLRARGAGLGSSATGSAG